MLGPNSLSVPQSAFRNPKFFFLLRARYEEITAAVSDQLARGLALEDVMGSRIDALKLVSSLALFRAAAERPAKEDSTFDSAAENCDLLLKQTAAQGYLQCTKTVARLTATTTQ